MGGVSDTENVTETAFETFLSEHFSSDVYKC